MSPGRKIPAHVFSYSLALTPAIVYAYYYSRNAPSDEELEVVLRKDYSSNIKSSENKRQQMADFIENVVKKPDSDKGAEHKLKRVLLAGKGEMKRQLHVDETVYGTEEGAKIASDLWEKAKLEQKEKTNNKKFREKKLSSKSDNDESSCDANIVTANAKNSNKERRKKDKKHERKTMNEIPAASWEDGGEHLNSSSRTDVNASKSAFRTSDKTMLVTVALIATTAGYFFGSQRPR